MLASLKTIFKVVPHQMSVFAFLSMAWLSKQFSRSKAAFRTTFRGFLQLVSDFIVATSTQETFIFNDLQKKTANKFENK